MNRALAFLVREGARPRASTYGSRLSGLRWRRAAGADREADWPEAARARDAVGGADSWVVVLEESSLPAGALPQPVPGRLLTVAAAGPSPGACFHTLRELQGARLLPAGGKPAAFAFRSLDFPARDDETVRLYIERLQSSPTDTVPAAIRFEEPSWRERPELTRRLSPGKLRILDAGCGAGAGLAAGKARNPGWEVTGIERDPQLAARAREVCDRVLEGDLTRILPRLGGSGERFDAIVFADVLEHLEDPVAVLAAARGVAAAGATLLVSVPNAGHLSIVRDLVLGRFDPVPAGLCDAGHLRWFTRGSLSEAVREADWRLESVEGEAGAPAPEPEAFLKLASAWPDCDRDSLETYQWIATARDE